MRCLVLAPHAVFPARSGLPLRVVHLARALAREMELELAAVSAPPSPQVSEPFQVSHLSGDWGRIRALLRATHEPWSVAQIHSAELGRYVRSAGWDVIQAHTLPMMRYVPSTKPSVFDALDVMSNVIRTMGALDPRMAVRPLWRFRASQTLRYETAVARRATAVTVPSEHDAELFERMGARRVVVVPNGVDLESVSYRAPAAGAGVTFVGYFAWRPNAEAAIELREEILPRIRERIASATLTLVGKAAPARASLGAHEAVELTGEVDDVVPHLQRARVTVMPLRAGSGTRLKVLEALAAGVPVVATPFAVQGIDLSDGVHALLADSPADLAELAVKVMEDDDLAMSLSRAGRRLVEGRYAWPAVAQPLVELHRELAELHASR